MVIVSGLQRKNSQKKKKKKAKSESERDNRLRVDDALAVLNSLRAAAATADAQ